MFRDLWKLRRLGRLVSDRNWRGVIAAIREGGLEDHRQAVEAKARAVAGIVGEFDRASSAGELEQAVELANLLVEADGSDAARARQHAAKKRLQFQRKLAEEARLGMVALIVPDPSHRPAPSAPKSTIPSKSRGLVPGTPFILRVEERGDWLVLSSDVVAIGSAQAGEADLPIMAAIGRRHLLIERVVATEPNGVTYRAIPDRERSCSKNGQPFSMPVGLNHGDRLGLGPSLSCVWLRPVAKSPNAGLELPASFPAHGCRKIVLARMQDRESALVVGPAPEAHVGLASESDRLELYWSRDDLGAPILLARAPTGVSFAGGPERPQVRVEGPGELRTRTNRIFLDTL